MKKILFVDMDNVLVDFQSGIDRLAPGLEEQYEGRLDEVPGIFALMDPLEGAIEAYHQLDAVYDTYILSTAPWENPSAWTDKLLWVKKYLGGVARKRLIISHNKNLNCGDYLIDDRTKNGAGAFPGEHIHFGHGRFTTGWPAVLTYLLPNQPTNQPTNKPTNQPTTHPRSTP
jgi:5'-nucleotidase